MSIAGGRRVLVLGAGGQVGRALRARFAEAGVPVDAFGRDQVDLGHVDDARLAWGDYGVVVNAAAWTDVDGAETDQGRRDAWRANATGPAALARIAERHGAVMVHFSSEYVFDGRKAGAYVEDDEIAPLSAYGATKAAGDLAVSGVGRHYLLRPTWLVGQGRNFVGTMCGLADRGVEPTVVADQVGRPTFAGDLADALLHLLDVDAPFGTYHVTGGGEPGSWFDVARAVYDLVGRPDLTVAPTTAAEYSAGRPGVADRPANSVLDLGKAVGAGVDVPDWRSRLERHLAEQGRLATRS